MTTERPPSEDSDPDFYDCRCSAPKTTFDPVLRKAFDTECGGLVRPTK